MLPFERGQAAILRKLQEVGVPSGTKGICLTQPDKKGFVLFKVFFEDLVIEVHEDELEKMEID